MWLVVPRRGQANRAAVHQTGSREQVRGAAQRASGDPLRVPKLDVTTALAKYGKT
jgi:hypothetical protein